MDLPNEVLLLVFEFLGVRDLASCARVCSQWTGLAATNTLWLAHFHRAIAAAPSSSSSSSARQARVVDWKRELRGAWSAKRNWRLGRPTGHEAYANHSRVSGLCFDHRFLYAGLDRGSVQVFDLKPDLDGQASNEEDNDNDNDNDDMALSDPTPPLSTAAATLPRIIFPRSSSSGEDEDGGQKAEEQIASETGVAVPETPTAAHGSRKKPVTLHSPHSSYSDVLTLHQGRLYAVSGRNITVWNVDVDEATEIQRVEIAFEGHTNKVSCVDFRDHHMITGSWDRTVRVWDINTGVCLTSMSGHTANIKHLQAVTNRVVSSSNDNTAYAAVSAFHYDPDRDLIVLGHREGTVQRLSYSQIFAHTSFPLRMPGSVEMQLHQQIVHKIQMDADKVLSSGQDGIVAVWDLATGGLMYYLAASRRGSLNAMQFDHTQLFYASASSVIRLTFAES